MTLTKQEIAEIVKTLERISCGLCDLVWLYARGDATEDSDIDLIVFGGEHFKSMNIFAFSEDLRQLTQKKLTHLKFAK